MKLTSKGQVTVPVAVRRALGLKPGMEVRFEVDGSGARLVAGGDAAAEVARITGAGNGNWTTDDLLASRHDE